MPPVVSESPYFKAVLDPGMRRIKGDTPEHVAELTQFRITSACSQLDSENGSEKAACVFSLTS